MGDGAQRTVVVVDDQSVIRELFRLLMEDDPRFAPVLLAADPEAAMALVREHQPDAVLLDVDLAGEDGLALVPQVRAAAPGAAVIVFSSASRASAQAAARSGADAFVAKGTDVDEVLDLLVSASPHDVVDLRANQRTLS
jgi:DNA-binding NarL/FixJ family response regulator